MHHSQTEAGDDIIAQVIQEGVTRGHFRSVDHSAIAAQVFSLININLMIRALGQKPIDPALETQAVMSLILNGIAERTRASSRLF